jgi:hypothetical protein
MSDFLASLPSRTVATIGDAIDQMRWISDALPAADGLACFNRMYLVVTENVLNEVTATEMFEEPAFMSRLDVNFANLYFGAIGTYKDCPDAAPRCWRELLENRDHGHIAPMRFAMAGMSAHINHDLPIAVVATCKDLNTAPKEGSHAVDFERVNALLDTLDERIRESFEAGVLLELDRKAAELENLAGSFAIGAARRAAWESALALWHLRWERRLTRDYEDGLDDAASIVARSLMLPLP